ncbi:MAG: response regulator, partial [Ruminococcus sp.]|nr:response regulator [Ruminococcus sp.]
VDDNEISIEIEKMMLESCGLTVLTAESGTKAVELAENQDFFMIFMDIHMPEMDGYEASRLIRETNKSVPIIALTADSISEAETRFAESGIVGYLSKPLQMDELQELLQNYININPVSENEQSDRYFDYDALSAVLNDEKAVQRLLTQFISAHGNDCENLRKNVISENYISAREILHNIIGISGNLFCKKLYSISCRLSSELKKEYSDSFDTFEEVWDKTIIEIESCIKKVTENPETVVKKQFPEIWKEFFSLCTEFDISAVDVFTENKEIFMNNMEKSVFEQLETAVMNYDFLRISENMEGFNV